MALKKREKQVLPFVSQMSPSLGSELSKVQKFYSLPINATAGEMQKVTIDDCYGS